MGRTKVFIMAGGSGTRLAPLSLTIPGKLPKQFLKLVGDKTLLQAAADRVSEDAEIIIIPEERYVDEVNSQLGGTASSLAEPFGCNTATAIALAIKDLADDEVCFFMPADHLMDKDVFQDILKKVVEKAIVTPKIITIGITPDRPEIGYGYIKTADKDGDFINVEKFVEKPNLEKAKDYLAEGGYFWNAGMFGFQVKVMKESLVRNAEYIWNQVNENDVLTAYTNIKESKNNISIDYAVMEKEAANMILFPAPVELAWDDVGGWEALQKYLDYDGSNYKLGKVSFANSNNSQVMNYLDKELKIDGLEDVLMIATDNGIVILPLSLSSRVKEVIPAIEAGEETLLIEADNISINRELNNFVAVIGINDLTVEVNEKEIIVSKR